MKKQIETLLATLGPQLDAMVEAMYHNPELGDEEHMASGLHMEVLRQYGFEVEHPLCGRPTGFRAVFDSGLPGPTVAFMSEYDALPEIGHGCGHNIHGAAATGAGIALKAVMHSLGGRVIVLGTPAEERDGAKISYVEAGIFADIDCAMMAHSYNRWLRSGTSLSSQSLTFEFFGKAAHAASAPELGINALDAGLVTMTAINALREHVRSDSRIHGIVADGGRVANVVPDYCRLCYMVRSTSHDYNRQLIDKVCHCAEAGALATGARLEITRPERGLAAMRTNETLNGIFVDLAKALYDLDITEAKSGGATDAGNVSRVCPTIHPYFDITGHDLTNANHSRERAACTITPYAREQMRRTVCLLALTGRQVMADPGTLAAIRREFELSQS